MTVVESGVRKGPGGPAPVGRTLAIARPASFRVAVASLLGALAIAASIALMGTSAWLISRAAQHPNEQKLGIAIVAVQFFGLSRGFCRYGERLVGHDAAFRVLASLRVAVYQRLVCLAPAGLRDFRRGDLLARLVQDVDSLQDVVLRVVPPFAVALAVGAAAVAVEWALLPAAGVALLIVLVIGATAVPWLTGRMSRQAAARQSSARRDLAISTVDLVQGAPELVAFGRIPAQVEKVRDADTRLARALGQSATTSGVGIGTTTLLAGVAAWAAATAGVVAVHSGQMPGVDLAVATLIPLAALELVAALPAATQSMHKARQAAGRVFDVIDTPAPVGDPASPRSLPHAPFTLEVESAAVRYPKAPGQALRGVDLCVAPGRRVAVVGPSGAGKSTLAAMLLRFLPYESGSVRLNGVELDQLAAEDVRRVVGYVDQGAYLFDTSVAQNLRVGRPEASDEELHDVLRRVGLDSWLASLPQGLATEVGRDGSRLSGGQRQRVATARALLAAFPVLVLDEPAEHLEPAAADALIADLLELTEGRATVLITHRLTGLEAVDEVLVMEHGRVIERGTHRQLLEMDGWYARRWWDEVTSEACLAP
jgi:thiol reductant ABC exporter CydC subunit